MSFRFVQGDVFEVDLPRRSFALVYADPPYAGCRFKYARKNGSRQWGRNARADFMRELVARCEALRAPDGMAAISMGSPELRLLHLFPTNARVFPWVKPFAPFRPHVWPCYAWEPVVAWGQFPGRDEQKASKTPHDWLQLSPKVPKKGGHETPKPDEFAEWVINLTLGPRHGDVCELFAGTAPVALAAARRGLAATAVDLDDYRPEQDDIEAHIIQFPAAHSTSGHAVSHAVCESSAVLRHLDQSPHDPEAGQRGAVQLGAPAPDQGEGR